MKEFIRNNKITYNLMSFTGFKALIIFSMLLEGPCSYDDIINYFENHEFLREKISIDTIRVYINSLKRAGCNITKTKRIDGGKFVLVSHPLELTINNEQIKIISKIYKTISKTVEIEELILLEKFLRKIAKNTKNNEFRQTLDKISLLSSIDTDLLDELMNCCKSKKQIILKYNSPHSVHTDMEIICDKLGFENGKLYIYGTSLDYSQAVYLLANRIIKIKEIKQNKTKNIKIEEIKVKFELKADIQEVQLKENEKLISIHNNKIIIEAKSSNKFALKQRILSFGSQCKVIEPEIFKKEIISTLQKMRAEY